AQRAVRVIGSSRNEVVSPGRRIDPTSNSPAFARWGAGAVSRSTNLPDPRGTWAATADFAPGSSQTIRASISRCRDPGFACTGAATVYRQPAFAANTVRI